jgi:hypothetical protein
MLAHEPSIFVNREYLVGAQLTLIDPTRTHRNPERLPLDHHTQIPTRPQQPPTRMKPLRNGCQARRNVLKAI